MTGRVIKLALALAMVGSMTACGLFSEDEEPLEGERIPVRDLLNQRNTAPATTAPATQVAPTTPVTPPTEGVTAQQ